MRCLSACCIPSCTPLSLALDREHQLQITSQAADTSWGHQQECCESEAGHQGCRYEPTCILARSLLLLCCRSCRWRDLNKDSAVARSLMPHSCIISVIRPWTKPCHALKTLTLPGLGCYLSACKLNQQDHCRAKGQRARRLTAAGRCNVQYLRHINLAMAHLWIVTS